MTAGSGADTAAVTAFEALTIPDGAAVAPSDDEHPASTREFAALAFDVFDPNCPSRTILDHVTGRWGVLVLGGLGRRPTRFNALRRRVAGVSEKMLAQTLHALERDGFVTREVRSTIPPKVEYALTDLGEQVAVLLHHLVALIEDRGADVLTARRRYDAEHPDR
ncbi:Helix-turn-helix transcriptional regulator [Frankia sp. AiPs1]|uniref:winged helix-turn-helix transcriptional regulator n=1 Tax=Frankia sp. AiPa1 TaxID=573492 RepID=UPI00202B048D|nr:helix-turn-helix domain-containing protein [Frankia sp. AiPa1]MCL9761313.1 helix-turn-helix transcriptional regulator [Frankia sp. AiPa1]